MTTFDKSLIEQSLFENYNGDSYNKLLASLKIANRNIERRLLSVRGEWTRSRLNDMKKLINDEISKAYEPLQDNLKNEAVKVANVVNGFHVGELGKKVDTKVANSINNSNRDIQGYSFKELFGLSSDNHARQLRVLLASGVNQGRAIDGIIKDFNIKSDKLSKGQIRTNVRTFISEARTEARHESFKELEKTGVIKAYQYEATIDSRTSQWCLGLSGRIYKDLESIEKDLHHHFNCRTVAKPLTETSDQDILFGRNEYDKIRLNEIADDLRDVGLNNLIPTLLSGKSLSYADWFALQSDEFHKATLTPTQYEAFKDGELNVDITDLVKANSLEAIEEVMEKMQSPIIDYSINTIKSKSKIVASEQLLKISNKVEDMGTLTPELIDGIYLGLNDVLSMYKNKGKVESIEKTKKKVLGYFKPSSENNGVFAIGQLKAKSSLESRNEQLSRAKETFRQQLNNSKAAVAQYKIKKEQGKKIPPILQKAFDEYSETERTLENTKRWNVALSARNEFEYSRLVFNHEAWHKIDIDNNLKDKFESEYIKAKQKYNIKQSDIVKVSAYAYKGGLQEMFAEIGSLYSSGRKSEIPIGILEAFENTIKGLEK